MAEHLYAKHADKLVETLTRSARHAIYFTAAPPGQGGLDHVNEQPHEYWIEKFNVHGWMLDAKKTVDVRELLLRVIREQHWYTHNSMVFIPTARPV